MSQFYCYAFNFFVEFLAVFSYDELMTIFAMYGVNGTLDSSVIVRNKETNMDKLDLSGVRIYSNTKNDIMDAMDLIGQDVYMSDGEKFENYYIFRLIGVKVIENESYPFLGYDGYDRGGRGRESYKYFILEKDAKFKEEKEKELRPFKSSWEFTEVTGCNIGDVITIHRVDGGFDESCIVSGFKYLDTEPSKPSIVYVILGADKYTFEELLQYFKYRKDDEWYSFGIEE